MSFKHHCSHACTLYSTLCCRNACRPIFFADAPRPRLFSEGVIGFLPRCILGNTAVLATLDAQNPCSVGRVNVKARTGSVCNCDTGKRREGFCSRPAPPEIAATLHSGLPRWLACTTSNRSCLPSFSRSSPNRPVQHNVECLHTSYSYLRTSRYRR